MPPSLSYYGSLPRPRGAALKRVRHHVNPLAEPHQRVVVPPSLPPAWFADPSRPLHIDIGCGHGEFVHRLAERSPGRNFLGLEIRGPLVVSALARKARDGLGNVHFLQCNANCNLLPLSRILPMPVVAASILHPDPWFKERHRKRRVVNRALVEQLAALLGPGARLYLQSDVAELQADMRAFVDSDPAFDLVAAAGGASEGEGTSSPPPLFQAELTEREAVVRARGGAIHHAVYVRRREERGDEGASAKSKVRQPGVSRDATLSSSSSIPLSSSSSPASSSSATSAKSSHGDKGAADLRVLLSDGGPAAQVLARHRLEQLVESGEAQAEHWRIVIDLVPDANTSRAVLDRAVLLGTVAVDEGMFASVLRKLAHEGRHDEIPAMCDTMRRSGLDPDCAKVRGALNTAAPAALRAMLRKRRRRRQNSPSAHAKQEPLYDAAAVAEGLSPPDPDDVAAARRSTARARARARQEADRIFAALRASGTAEPAHFDVFVSAARSPEQAQVLLDEAFAAGIRPDALADIVTRARDSRRRQSKHGTAALLRLLRAGQRRKARAFFEDLVRKGKVDTIHVNTMLSRYCTDAAQAGRLVAQIPRWGIAPDAATFNTLVHKAVAEARVSVAADVATGSNVTTSADAGVHVRRRLAMEAAAAAVVRRMRLAGIVPNRFTRHAARGHNQMAGRTLEAMETTLELLEILHGPGCDAEAETFRGGSDESNSRPSSAALARARLRLEELIATHTAATHSSGLEHSSGGGAAAVSVGQHAQQASAAGGIDAASLVHNDHLALVSGLVLPLPPLPPCYLQPET